MRTAKNMFQSKRDFEKYTSAQIGFETKRDDNAPVKRVELRAHTEMSAMDGDLVSARDLVERAAEWGHKAISITDSNVARAFPEAYRASMDKNIKIIFGADVELRKNGNNYVATLLATNLAGLKNLYKLVSLSRTEYFCDAPETAYVPVDVLVARRDGLLVGSGCFGGDVYDAIHRGDPEDNISEIAKFYDYLELDVTEDESANVVLARIGEILNRPVVATGNVHYLDPKDKAVHRVLREARGHGYSERGAWHFRTTEDMLAEVRFLGEDKAYEVVVTNSNLIADMIEEMPPIPEGFYLPTLDGADDEMVTICNTRAREIYGTDLPDHVKERLDYELNNILRNGYAVIYMIAQKLVKKSNEDGLMVGTRGSAGASLVAYLLGITGIDPLKYNIPFETFAGIDGNKVPDIDFNFSGDYQVEIQRYVEEVFGKDKVFRAGIVGTEVATLASGVTGVKKTTGQHPGGVFILPADKEIYDFTPIQYPENRKDSGVLTTHFEYHFLDDTLLKIDLFAHDSPTMIKMLEDLTGVDARTVPFDDEKTLNMLATADTLGIPDFGDTPVRNMIKTIEPKTFDDFVKISGLSHGTGVWRDNAENLIKAGTAAVSEVIALRDEIMVYVMGKGICRETAFHIMESVRKGRGLSDEYEKMLSKSGVPEWYIESCDKIEYLFPKAHAVAYAMMFFRVAWFKAHHPEAFYKAYFKTKNRFENMGFMVMDAEETQR